MYLILSSSAAGPLSIHVCLRRTTYQSRPHVVYLRCVRSAGVCRYYNIVVHAGGLCLWLWGAVRMRWFLDVILSVACVPCVIHSCSLPASIYYLCLPSRLYCLCSLNRYFCAYFERYVESKQTLTVVPILKRAGYIEVGTWLLIAAALIISRRHYLQCRLVVIVHLSWGN